MNNAKLNKIFASSESANDVIENYDDEEIEDENLNEAAVQIANKELAKKIDETDKIQDADYSRRVLQNLLDKGQQLLNIALENAADGKARDVEVASGVLNTVANLSEKLITIHEQINKINTKSAETGTGNTYINNQNKTIITTTHDLLDKILQEQDSENN